jgi:DNA repair photolyase
MAVEPGGLDDVGSDRRVVATEYYRDTSRSVISHNDSPDIPFEVSLNPYRGCEHGCVYCYARPSHEYLGLSAGLDFETKLFVKERAPALLRAEIARRRWVPRELVLSGVTDAYQPIERTLRLTRACLEVLRDARHPVSVVTKNALVTRDIDLLADLAGRGAATVAISVTTLDDDLRRTMEPRTPTSDMRLDTSRACRGGHPDRGDGGAHHPGLTDHEIPRIVARAADAGARFASYTVVRLPLAVKDLFGAWAGTHYPDRANKVLNQVRAVRGGVLNDPRFGHRMHGSGPVADVIRALFQSACVRSGLTGPAPTPSAAHFRRPSDQRSLFDDDVR